MKYEDGGPKDGQVAPSGKKFVKIGQIVVKFVNVQGKNMCFSG